MGVSTSPSRGLVEALASPDLKRLLAEMHEALKGGVLPDVSVGLIGKPTPTEITVNLVLSPGELSPWPPEGELVDIWVNFSIRHRWGHVPAFTLLGTEHHPLRPGEGKELTLKLDWPADFAIPGSDRDDYTWVVLARTAILQETTANDIVFADGSWIT